VTHLRRAALVGSDQTLKLGADLADGYRDKL
jgi:hypothetical protein